MSRTDFKERMRNGDILIGVSAPPNSTKSQMEDILGKDDYAFINTDSQHSAFNEETLVQFCNYADELDIPVQFRIKHTFNTYLIGNILDLGPAGIEIPQVEEPETVDEALKYFYYPQVGRRSWGGTGRWQIAGNSDRLEYADWWNNHGWLCLQMESIQAVSNALQLAKAGVDCLTWGPNDLLYDIEAHPQHPFRTVDDCVQHVLKQLEGTNIRINFRSYDFNLRNKYIDMGVTMLMESPKP
jgi:2-keto-3-deoxy-L-rhamnonate aldolase RhmA